MHTYGNTGRPLLDGIGVGWEDIQYPLTHENPNSHVGLFRPQRWESPELDINPSRIDNPCTSNATIKRRRATQTPLLIFIIY